MTEDIVSRERHLQRHMSLHETCQYIKTLLKCLRLRHCQGIVIKTHYRRTVYNISFIQRVNEQITFGNNTSTAICYTSTIQIMIDQDTLSEDAIITLRRDMETDFTIWWKLPTRHRCWELRLGQLRSRPEYPDSWRLETDVWRVYTFSLSFTLLRRQQYAVYATQR